MHLDFSYGVHLINLYIRSIIVTKSSYVCVVRREDQTSTKGTKILLNEVEYMTLKRILVTHKLYIVVTILSTTLWFILSESFQRRHS